MTGFVTIASVVAGLVFTEALLVLFRRVLGGL
jgi:hypothetical protein